MKWLRKLRIPIMLIVMPAIILLVHNYLSNGHYHKLPSGHVIYHYHPYKNLGDNAPFATHKHNPTELFILQLMSYGEFFLTAMVFMLALAIQFFVKKHSIYQPGISTYQLFNNLIPRAPPLA